ncbi:MAG TPA: MotA/TolQ/ExbB proton channel family protein [Gammaproteobacteria bacterium]|nr:MotA/TolQ/ExbB proton channel family protein [Gammaproteobacteria bacterium]
MRKSLAAATGIILAAFVAASAFAEAAPATTNANSLDQLLNQVQSISQQEQAQMNQARAQFAAASPEQQKAMMKQAQAALDQAKAAASQASDQYSANEMQIGKMEDQINAEAQAADLSGVFSTAQKDADNLATTLQNALTNTQFSPPAGETGRLAFLQGLANSNGTPTLDDLQRLWYIIQHEMTAQGQVVSYQAPVVQANNKSVVSKVIRVGPFTASSEGRFLQYLPDLNILSVLPRKLPSNFRSILASFQNAHQGYARAVIDPSGSGALIGLYINRPTWLQRIQLGQGVGYVIIAVGIIGALLFFFQIFRLIAARIAVNKQLKDLGNPRNDNPLGRVLLAFKGDPDRIEEEADIAELRITEQVLREEPRLERFQSYLRLAVAAGPLLGLIGTVVGMIETFQTITDTGSADPRLMATGIGHAMIATVLGLGVAIPLLFGNALLKSLSDSIVQILDKQSSGMLAERIEQQQSKGAGKAKERRGGTA